MLTAQQKMKPSIKEFLDTNVKNIWLHSNWVAVYVRRGKHIIHGDIRNCLDIANVEVKKEYRGKGLFTEWLSHAENDAKEAGLDSIFIESILNNRLRYSLYILGYREVVGTKPICMFKYLQKEKTSTA